MPVLLPRVRGWASACAYLISDAGCGTLRRVPDEPGQADVVAGQRELLSRLRAVVEAKDAENAVLRAELDAERELRRRLELRLEELERRLRMDSTDSGTPTSKEGTGARERRRAERQDPDPGAQEGPQEGRAARPPRKGPGPGPGPGRAEGNAAARAVSPVQGGP